MPNDKVGRAFPNNLPKGDQTPLKGLGAHYTAFSDRPIDLTYQDVKNAHDRYRQLGFWQAQYQQDLQNGQLSPHSQQTAQNCAYGHHESGGMATAYAAAQEHTQSGYAHLQIHNDYGQPTGSQYPCTVTYPQSQGPTVPSAPTEQAGYDGLNTLFADTNYDTRDMSLTCAQQETTYQSEPANYQTGSAASTPCPNNNGVTNPVQTPDVSAIEPPFRLFPANMDELAEACRQLKPQFCMPMVMYRAAEKLDAWLDDDPATILLHKDLAFIIDCIYRQLALANADIQKLPSIIKYARELQIAQPPKPRKFSLNKKDSSKQHFNVKKKLNPLLEEDEPEVEDKSPQDLGSDDDQSSDTENSTPSSSDDAQGDITVTDVKAGTMAVDFFRQQLLVLQETVLHMLKHRRSLKTIEPSNVQEVEVRLQELSEQMKPIMDSYYKLRIKIEEALHSMEAMPNLTQEHDERILELKQEIEVLRKHCIECDNKITDIKSETNTHHDALNATLLKVAQKDDKDATIQKTTDDQTHPDTGALLKSKYTEIVNTSTKQLADIFDETAKITNLVCTKAHANAGQLRQQVAAIKPIPRKQNTKSPDSKSDSASSEKSKSLAITNQYKHEIDDLKQQFNELIDCYEYDQHFYQEIIANPALRIRNNMNPRALRNRQRNNAAVARAARLAAAAAAAAARGQGGQAGQQGLPGQAGPGGQGPQQNPPQALIPPQPAQGAGNPVQNPPAGPGHGPNQPVGNNPPGAGAQNPPQPPAGPGGGPNPPPPPAGQGGPPQLPGGGGGGGPPQPPGGGGGGGPPNPPGAGGGGGPPNIPGGGNPPPPQGNPNPPPAPGAPGGGGGGPPNPNPNAGVQNPNDPNANNNLLQQFFNLLGAAQNQNPHHNPQKAIMLLPNKYDGADLKKARNHWKEFEHFVSFQKDQIATYTEQHFIKMFAHTLTGYASQWYDGIKDNITTLEQLRNEFLSFFNVWGRTDKELWKSWAKMTFDPKDHVERYADDVKSLGAMLDVTDKQMKGKFRESFPKQVEAALTPLEDWEELVTRARTLNSIFGQDEKPSSSASLLAHIEETPQDMPKTEPVKVYTKGVSVPVSTPQSGTQKEQTSTEDKAQKQSGRGRQRYKGGGQYKQGTGTSQYSKGNQGQQTQQGQQRKRDQAPSRRGGYRGGGGNPQASDPDNQNKKCQFCQRTNHWTKECFRKDQVLLDLLKEQRQRQQVATQASTQSQAAYAQMPTQPQYAAHDFIPKANNISLDYVAQTNLEQ